VLFVPFVPLNKRQKIIGDGLLFFIKDKKIKCFRTNKCQISAVNGEKGAKKSQNLQTAGKLKKTPFWERKMSAKPAFELLAARVAKEICTKQKSLTGVI
jgi:hypothetical protein